MHLPFDWQVATTACPQISSPAPPSNRNMITSGCKKRIWQKLSCQVWGFKNSSQQTSGWCHGGLHLDRQPLRVSLPDLSVLNQYAIPPLPTGCLHWVPPDLVTCRTVRVCIVLLAEVLPPVLFACWIPSVFLYLCACYTLYAWTLATTNNHTMTCFMSAFEHSFHCPMTQA